MDKRSNNQVPNKLDLEKIKKNSKNDAVKKSQLEKFETVEREVVLQNNTKEKTSKTNRDNGKSASTNGKSAKLTDEEKRRKEKEARQAKKEKEAQKAVEKKQKEKELKRKMEAKAKQKKEKERLQKAKQKEKLAKKNEKRKSEVAKEHTHKSVPEAKIKQEKKPAEDKPKKNKAVPDRKESPTKVAAAGEIDLPPVVEELKDIQTINDSAPTENNEQKPESNIENDNITTFSKLKKLAAEIKKFVSVCFSKEYKKYSFSVISAVCIIVVLVSSLCIRNHVLMKRVEYIYYGIDDTAVTRQIEIDKESQLEKVKELKRHGQKGKFKFFSRTEISFNEWYDEGILSLGNYEGNDCTFIVTLLDTDGFILYRSDGIKAGEYLPSIRLSRELDNGKHSRKLYVSAYDPDTRKLIGVQYIDVTLIIGD